MNSLLQVHRLPRQQGIALVTVVLIVSVISLLAFELAASQQTWISREQNLQDRAQAEWVRLGAEDYASLILSRDEQNGTIDSLNEKWAGKFPPFPAEQGKVAIKIDDLQGRFNLNSLMTNNTYNADYGNVFKNLLLQENINPGKIDAVLDWMDSDSNTRANGAEDDYYMNLKHGYRASNRLFSSAKELELVKGFTLEDVKKLESSLTALPTPTRININTAPAPVIAALYQGMSIEEANRVVAARLANPFNSIGDLATRVDSKYPKPKDSIIGVSSNYFLITSFVEFGHYFQQTGSTLYRPGVGKPNVYLSHERPLITLAQETKSE